MSSMPRRLQQERKIRLRHEVIDTGCILGLILMPVRPEDLEKLVTLKMPFGKHKGH